MCRGTWGGSLDDLLVDVRAPSHLIAQLSQLDGTSLSESLIGLDQERSEFTEGEIEVVAEP